MRGDCKMLGAGGKCNKRSYSSLKKGREIMRKQKTPYTQWLPEKKIQTLHFFSFYFLLCCDLVDVVGFFYFFFFWRACNEEIKIESVTRAFLWGLPFTTLPLFFGQSVRLWPEIWPKSGSHHLQLKRQWKVK